MPFLHSPKSRIIITQNTKIRMSPIQYYNPHGHHYLIEAICHLQPIWGNIRGIYNMGLYTKHYGIPCSIFKHHNHAEWHSGCSERLMNQYKNIHFFTHKPPTLGGEIRFRYQKTDRGELLYIWLTNSEYSGSPQEVRWEVNEVCSRVRPKPSRILFVRSNTRLPPPCSKLSKVGPHL